MLKVKALPEKDLLKVGIELKEKERTGTFIQKDKEILVCNIKQKDVELLSTKDALEILPWSAEYLWKALREDSSLADFENGYFIWAKKGAKPLFPVQSCLYIATEGYTQHVHNIVIVEEDAELHVITGCTAGARKGLHLGVSEFYVKRGAVLHFTMIHAWGEEIETFPKTGVVVEEEGVFISDYICMHPGKQIKMYPDMAEEQHR